MNTINQNNTAVQQPKRLATQLTYLGVLPFILAALIALSQYISLPAFLGGDIAYAGFKSKALMHSYAVVILSFLGGIQWGVLLQQQSQHKRLLLSSAIALMAWISLMAFTTTLAFIILLIGYALALFSDRNAHINHLIPAWFWELRKRITSVVCVAILVVVFLA